jgi:predicted O-methyltransferase YrrM
MSTSGVAIEQNPWEFAELLLLLRRVEPPIESVLEVGVFQGGTLAQFAAALPRASVVGIDPKPMLAPGLRLWAFPMVVNGCSQDPLVRQRAVSLNDGAPFDFAFIDGDHTLPAVTEDWEWARREVRRIVAFHDIACEDREPIQVKPLWDAILASGEYETEEIRCDVGRYGIGVVYL